MEKDPEGQKLHGEQHLYYSLSKNGADFIDDICTYLYLTKNITSFDGIILDIHTTNDMCPFCMMSLIMHWYKQNGIIEKLSTTMQSNNFYFFSDMPSYRILPNRSLFPIYEPVAEYATAKPYSFLPLVSSVIPYTHPGQSYPRRDVGYDDKYDSEIIMRDFCEAYRIPQMFISPHKLLPPNKLLFGV